MLVCPAEGDGESETLMLGVGEALKLGEREGERDGLGEIPVEALCELETDALGDTEALGEGVTLWLSDGDTDALGETDALGDRL